MATLSEKKGGESNMRHKLETDFAKKDYSFQNTRLCSTPFENADKKITSTFTYNILLTAKLWQEKKCYICKCQVV